MDLCGTAALCILMMAPSLAECLFLSFVSLPSELAVQMGFRVRCQVTLHCAVLKRVFFGA